MAKTVVCSSPDDTFAAGEELGSSLSAGDLVFLIGGLGAGKTLFAKGVLQALGYDIDEVTSPSFTLVNLYRTDRFDVYHIDLWRLDNNPAEAVGLDDILDNPKAVTLIEWADRLGQLEIPNFTIRVSIDGVGDECRHINIDVPVRRAVEN